MSAAACETEFKTLLEKLNTVIREKWPEALLEDLNPYEWARANLSHVMKRYDALFKECEELWANGQVKEFKSMVKDWGRTVLEIMKQYAAHIRQREAA